MYYCNRIFAFSDSGDSGVIEHPICLPYYLAYSWWEKSRNYAFFECNSAKLKLSDTAGILTNLSGFILSIDNH